MTAHWIFRLSTIAVLVSLVWAIAPFRLDHSFFKRVAIALFAFACWRSARQLLLFLPAPGLKGSSDLPSWGCLAGLFDAGTVVGYLGPVKAGEIAVDYGFRPEGRPKESLEGMFRLVDVESALAPAVVVNRNDTEYVVVDPRASLGPLEGSYERVLRCPSGVALFRRRHS